MSLLVKDWPSAVSQSVFVVVEISDPELWDFLPPQQVKINAGSGLVEALLLHLAGYASPAIRLTLCVNDPVKHYLRDPAQDQPEVREINTLAELNEVLADLTESIRELDGDQYRPIQESELL